MRACKALVLGLLLSALPVIGWAQGSAVVTGTVSDETGGVLPGVTVTLMLSGPSATLETVTNEAGVYRFDGVPGGQAELTLRMINFASVRRSIAVPASGTVTSNAVMIVAASADIVITAPRTFRNLAEIENPAENLVGVASAGSEGAITAAQLAVRPVNRAAEILETVPGMVISQHSGEGKANQYYLRGFNLDHGFDFAQTVAGIPVNMPTHAHAQGYADSNFLIPELVSGVQFRKGPYYAENGDFSSAGSANINYFNVLDRPIVTLRRRFVRLRARSRRRVAEGRARAICSGRVRMGARQRPVGQSEQQGQVQRRGALQPGRCPQRTLRSPSSASRTTGTRPIRFRSAPSTRD